MNQEEMVMNALDYIQKNDVKFIRLQFCDLLGQNRNIAITAMQIERALTKGMGFDGSLIPGLTNKENPDLLLRPDMDTIQLLPWRPQQGKVARIICDICYPDGSIYELDSRQILKNTLNKAKARGYDFYTSAGCQFYLFQLDEAGKPTTIPTDQAGYFEMAPYDRGENTRREICLTLEDMGFEIESSRHEKGPGQHEIDFKYDQALTSADKIMTFKTVVKTVAQRHGLHASFLPKPLMDAPGSGMHINIFMEKNDVNIFKLQAGKLSKEAAAFIAGVLGHIKGITAIANPLINSYKRLLGGCDAPRFINYGYQNRLALIRLPKENGGISPFEWRSPDPTCNPYLTLALVLAAGLAGIEKKSLLNQDLLISNQKADKTDSDQELPLTLIEGLHLMEEDQLIRAVLGESLVKKYIDVKKNEWDEYAKTVHCWEIDNYLPVY